MRFVFTAPRYHTNQHFVVKALLAAGHEVSFLALGRGQSEYYEAIQPIVLGEAGVVRLWRRVWRQMRALRPDVVVVRNPLTAFGLVSIATARLTGSAVVLYSHTPMHMRFRWWQKLKGWAVTWMSRAAWTTPVLGQPDRHPPGLGAMRYVPFVIEPQTAPERREWFRDGAVNVLCIGKFQERKNHRLFLEAVSRLSRRYPVRATVVGECTREEHRRELAGVEELRASLGARGEGRCQDEPAVPGGTAGVRAARPVRATQPGRTGFGVRAGSDGAFASGDMQRLERDSVLHPSWGERVRVRYGRRRRADGGDG